jgi:hypothetical protein
LSWPLSLARHFFAATENGSTLRPSAVSIPRHLAVIFVAALNQGPWAGRRKCLLPAQNVVTKQFSASPCALIFCIIDTLVHCCLPERQLAFVRAVPAIRRPPKTGDLQKRNRAPGAHASIFATAYGLMRSRRPALGVMPSMRLHTERKRRLLW